MSKVIEGLYYGESHEYVKVDGDYGYIGITDYAQHALGNIVYVDSICDDDFFARLAYKPYLLTAPVSSHYNLYKDEFFCPVCNERMTRLSDAQVVNSAFKLVCGCKNCNKKFWIFVRARKTYDGVTLSKRAATTNKSRAKKY